MDHILIVEDDRALSQGIRLALDQAGRQFTQCHTLREAEEALAARPPQLVILDLNLPDGNGLDLLRRLRASSPLPVLILTANDLEVDQVLGLELGADDYVAKPFGMMELMARIRAALRHGGQEAPKEKTYSLGSLFVDPARHIVRDGDREVTLTLKEFQVLCLLLERAGTVFTRDQLLNTIWGYEFDGASRTVDVHIRTLRQKLGHSGDCIETVRGIGYKISTDLSAGTARNE